MNNKKVTLKTKVTSDKKTTIKRTFNGQIYKEKVTFKRDVKSGKKSTSIGQIPVKSTKKVIFRRKVTSKNKSTIKKTPNRTEPTYKKGTQTAIIETELHSKSTSNQGIRGRKTRGHYRYAISK